MTIADTTLRQNVWTTIRGLLVAGSYTTSVSPTISGNLIEDEPTFPQIVIDPILVDKDSFTIGTDRRTSSKDIDVTISIYAKVHKDLEILDDEIDYIMTGSIPGITLYAQNAASTSGTFNGHTLKVKTLTYSFTRR